MKTNQDQPDDMPEHYIQGIREALADIAKSAETAMQFRQSQDFKRHAKEIFGRAQNIIIMCETGPRMIEKNAWTH